MVHRHVAWIASVLLVANLGVVRADEPAKASPEDIKVAIAKALPLIAKGAKGHIEQRTCFACHNQTEPMLAVAAAREHGFQTNDGEIKEQLDFIVKFLAPNREKYLLGKGQGGQIDGAGHALLTLEMGGWKADGLTESMVEYILLRNKDLTYWKAVNSTRQPTQGSHFTVTYLAVRALKKWGNAAQKEKIDKRIADARGWLLTTPAKDNEDRVYRLAALTAVGADFTDIEAARDELLRTQRPDGGWAQHETMESDAYATGTALALMRMTGVMRTDHPAYQRGLVYLLKTQHEDGSWQVKTHAKPIQVYFESGFPHGKDQFVSLAASGWAVTALALSCPPATVTAAR